ncbi:MAG TPA: hypothetical protein VEA59_05845 [Patescibacteria group bacterium]|nr:hypothetical protein [Patescibacteria group bacterium]
MNKVLIGCFLLFFFVQTTFAQQTCERANVQGSTLSAAAQSTCGVMIEGSASRYEGGSLIEYSPNGKASVFFLGTSSGVRSVGTRLMLTDPQPHPFSLGVVARVDKPHDSHHTGGMLLAAVRAEKGFLTIDANLGGVSDGLVTKHYSAVDFFFEPAVFKEKLILGVGAGYNGFEKLTEVDLTYILHPRVSVNVNIKVNPHNGEHITSVGGSFWLRRPH